MVFSTYFLPFSVSFNLSQLDGDHARIDELRFYTGFYNLSGARPLSVMIGAGTGLVGLVSQEENSYGN